LWLSCFPALQLIQNSYKGGEFPCYAPVVLLEMEGKNAMGKRRVIPIVFLLLFGLFSLLNSLSNPRVVGLHGADILRLVAAGLCFGVALGIMVGSRRFPGE